MTKNEFLNYINANREILIRYFEKPRLVRTIKVDDITFNSVTYIDATLDFYIRYEGEKFLYYRKINNGEEYYMLNDFSEKGIFSGVYQFSNEKDELEHFSNILDHKNILKYIKLHKLVN